MVRTMRGSSGVCGVLERGIEGGGRGEGSGRGVGVQDVEMLLGVVVCVEVVIMMEVLV